MNTYVVVWFMWLRVESRDRLVCDHGTEPPGFDTVSDCQICKICNWGVFPSTQRYCRRFLLLIVYLTATPSSGRWCVHSSSWIRMFVVEPRLFRFPLARMRIGHLSTDSALISGILRQTDISALSCIANPVLVSISRLLTSSKATLMLRSIVCDDGIMAVVYNLGYAYLRVYAISP
jgi:hypothetical protein